MLRLRCHRQLLLLLLQVLLIAAEHLPLILQRLLCCLLLCVVLLRLLLHVSVDVLDVLIKNLLVLNGLLKRGLQIGHGDALEVSVGRVLQAGRQLLGQHLILLKLSELVLQVSVYLLLILIEFVLKLLNCEERLLLKLWEQIWVVGGVLLFVGFADFDWLLSDASRLGRLSLLLILDHELEILLLKFIALKH